MWRTDKLGSFYERCLQQHDFLWVSRIFLSLLRAMVESETANEVKPNVFNLERKYFRLKIYDKFRNRGLGRGRKAEQEEENRNSQL